MPEPKNDISRFHNKHKGETCLLVGNGPNLLKTPPEEFDYLSIGSNTIFWYAGWRPTYYVAVDSCIMRDYWDDLCRYDDIPKFVPTPNLDKWSRPNFYRFYHRPGPLWPRCGRTLWPSNLLDETGITFSNVMHVQMQLAHFMGFTTMLIIGMEHGKHGRAHFWGWHDPMPDETPPEWLEGYKILREGMGATMLNLSIDTCVPESIIPRDDWKKWTRDAKKTREPL